MAKNNFLDLVGNIAPLESSTPVQAKHEVVLADYLKFYGFDELEAHCDSYAIGSIRSNGRKLVAHRWVLGSANQTVLVAHGLFDHVGLYLKLVSNLLGAGYSVAAIDFPGHGLSEGARAEIRHFDEYGDTLADFLELLVADESLPRHFFTAAQSTGSAAVANYLLRAGSTALVERAVLFAPLIYPCEFGKVKVLHWLLHRLVKRVPRRFSANSHDSEFCEFLAQSDTLQPHLVSVIWVAAMMKWARDFPSYSPSNTPVLAVQGTADATVDFEKNLPLLESKFSRFERVLVEGGLHHLINEGEYWRDQCFEQMLSFFSRAS